MQENSKINVISKTDTSIGLVSDKAGWTNNNKS